MKLKDATVLFVEDEPFLRESMGGWLKQHAGRALCAEHGEAALAILAADRVDLLVSDVRMPVMDGIALVEKLRQAGPMPRVIFVTGYSDLSLREAYEMGVDAIVEKPINREELVLVMEKSLAEPEEFWRHPSRSTAVAKLSAHFPSLAMALEQKSILFGRRGFSIKSPEVPLEGLVDFKVTFETDHQVLAGQGVVRWTNPQEGQAGIEITWLSDTSRIWVLDLLKQTAGTPFVPGCLPPRYLPGPRVA